MAKVRSSEWKGFAIESFTLPFCGELLDDLKGQFFTEREMHEPEGSLGRAVATGLSVSNHLSRKVPVIG